MTGDEFSKLSLKSKSLVSRQRMQWMIPQSRLNQQCPFLEKEYPYYTTDFSTLHYFTKDLEFKWKLTLERQGDNVVVDLSSCNDDDKSVKKEVKNILVNWSASISNSESSKNESLKTWNWNTSMTSQKASPCVQLTSLNCLLLTEVSSSTSSLSWSTFSSLGRSYQSCSRLDDSPPASLI